jgi:hypothetical protein
MAFVLQRGPNAIMDDPAVKAEPPPAEWAYKPSDT